MSAAVGEFTPFGYLRNPSHRATAWDQTRGGNLRAAADVVGVEWVYPVGQTARARCGLALELEIGGRPYRARSDFGALGLTSRHHTALVLGFDVQTDALTLEARFFLFEDDVLCVRLALLHRSGEVATRIVRFGDPDAALPQPHVLSIDASRAAAVQYAFLSRGPAQPDAAGAAQVLARLIAEDEAFAATCPSLSGAWPVHWAEGLHHDFQTTRLLVQQAGGIFGDIWPSWMVAWPRVVLAEGVLDMVRLAYVEPAVAQRAVLSLFRDAPMANVPCVFEGGEYTMLAADGSRCGTSPAWCLPFLQLEVLYLRHLDAAWLAAVYPLAGAYLRWWLAQRTDAEGWLVYKCTWESGEDGNPRLDPSGSGDADISARVRPVELQATMAHAANVMTFFARELGLPDEDWRALEADYRRRTQALFDPRAGRYRDWQVVEQRFLEPCPETPYWGVDACRDSPQALTPALIGEPLSAEEIWRHAGPPWTMWPSWTTTLVECAAAHGDYARVGVLATQTIERVYRVTTRREVASLARPMPGSAPEFWPLDWHTFDGHDAYGWGASTATLLLRHVLGFKESRRTDGWVAELTPALPDDFLRPGARYTVSGLTYRGVTFGLTYEVGRAGLVVHLDLDGAARELTVEAAESRELIQSGGPIYRQRGARHSVPIGTRGRYVLRLG